MITLARFRSAMLMYGVRRYIAEEVERIHGRGVDTKVMSPKMAIAALSLADYAINGSYPALEKDAKETEQAQRIEWLALLTEEVINNE